MEHQNPLSKNSKAAFNLFLNLYSTDQMLKQNYSDMVKLVEKMQVLKMQNQIIVQNIKATLGQSFNN